MSSSVPNGWREAKSRPRRQVDLAEILKNVPAGTREARRYKHRAHAVPSFLALYMACTPCPASTPHAAWVIDTFGSGRGWGFQVKATNTRRISWPRHALGVPSKTILR
jgi:hypothetical protein